MRIQGIICLVGVFNDATKSIDADKHKATLREHPAGVLVTRGDGKHGTALIPWTNIAWVRVADEVPAVLPKEMRR